MPREPQPAHAPESFIRIVENWIDDSRDVIEDNGGYGDVDELWRRLYAVEKKSCTSRSEIDKAERNSSANLAIFKAND